MDYHLTREMMIKEIKDIPIAIIRPTLIYGKTIHIMDMVPTVLIGCLIKMRI